MPYSSPHVLLRILGVFGPSVAGAAEQWGVSLRINTGSTGQGEVQKVAFLETIAAAVSTFHGSAGAVAGSSCWLTEMTAAYIGTDGHYVGGGSQNTTHRPFGTPGTGQGSNAVSWDVARVYTLRTAQPRGRGHVGRFYYPCQEAIATDGRWTSAQATAAATAAKTMLDAINQAAKVQWTASFGISVMSFIGDVSYPVNRVEVGRAPDSQRRRTKSLVEAPSGAALAGVLTSEEAALGRVYN